MNKEHSIAYTFAKKLQKIAIKTNTCPECAEYVSPEKTNDETKLSGLCTDCQPLYFKNEPQQLEFDFGEEEKI